MISLLCTFLIALFIFCIPFSGTLSVLFFVRIFIFPCPCPCFQNRFRHISHLIRLKILGFEPVISTICVRAIKAIRITALRRFLLQNCHLLCKRQFFVNTIRDISKSISAYWRTVVTILLACSFNFCKFLFFNNYICCVYLHTVFVRIASGLNTP